MEGLSDIRNEFGRRNVQHKWGVECKVQALDCVGLGDFWLWCSWFAFFLLGLDATDKMS